MGETETQRREEKVKFLWSHWIIQGLGIRMWLSNSSICQYFSTLFWQDETFLPRGLSPLPPHCHFHSTYSFFYWVHTPQDPLSWLLHLAETTREHLCGRSLLTTRRQRRRTKSLLGAELTFTYGQHVREFLSWPHSFVHPFPLVHFLKTICIFN